MLSFEAVLPHAVRSAAHPMHTVHPMFGIGECETQCPLAFVRQERTHAMTTFVVEHYGIHVQQSIGSLTPLDTVNATLVPEGIDHRTISQCALLMLGHLGLHSYGEGAYETIDGKHTVLVESDGSRFG